MFKGNKILALIPARGGSKGIKYKNIHLLAGKPLIAYTIEAALKSKYIDSTIITTDSIEIAEVAEKFGAEVPFMRPLEFAGDRAKTIDAVLHALAELKKQNRNHDVLVLLQPTSPLRTSDDIDTSLEIFFAHGERSLVSISPVEEHPLLIRSVSSKGEIVPLLSFNSTCRRQDMPEYYRVNGAIYINKILETNSNTSFNDNIIPFIMNKEHAIDIDEMKDLILAEYYISLNK